MKNLIATLAVFSVFFSAQADLARPASPAASPPQSSLEKAYAALKMAVDNARKENAARKAAHDAAVKKAAEVKKEAEAIKAAADKRAADAARQAESMKAAAAKAADIEQKTLAALEDVRKAIEASKK